MNCPACGYKNIAGSDECESCQASLTDIQSLVPPKRGMERRVIEGTVADLSPRPAIQVDASESLGKAVEAMRSAKIGCVLVIEGGLLRGVVSEREVLHKAGEAAFSAPVSAIMRSNPTVLRDDDQVAEVFNRMAMSGHLHVPVRRADGSYGVVSARDLLRYLCQ